MQAALSPQPPSLEVTPVRPSSARPPSTDEAAGTTIGVAGAAVGESSTDGDVGDGEEEVGEEEDVAPLPSMKQFTPVGKRPKLGKRRVSPAPWDIERLSQFLKSEEVCVLMYPSVFSNDDVDASCIALWLFLSSFASLRCIAFVDPM